MRKKKIFGIMLCCITVAVVALMWFYSHCEKMSMEAKNTYVSFLETLMSDNVAAIENYCHYEDPRLRKEAMFTSDHVTSYKVECFEQLNWKLWVAKTWIETTCYPEGRYIVNFVGVINGKKYVMTGSYQVPESLIKGCNLEDYLLTGPDVITYDDLIKE